MCALLPRIATHYKYRIVEVNGEDDHLHFLLECPPSASVASAVARLKSVSSKFFLDRYGSQFWGKHSRTLWNSGYFAASTGGVTLELRLATLVSALLVSVFLPFALHERSLMIRPA
jgi:REP element-mobilizing transposase RayT